IAQGAAALGAIVVSGGGTCSFPNATPTITPSFSASPSPTPNVCANPPSGALITLDMQQVSNCDGSGEDCIRSTGAADNDLPSSGNNARGYATFPLSIAVGGTYQVLAR